MAPSVRLETFSLKHPLNPFGVHNVARTVTVALSEAAIRKHGSDNEVSQLRDPSRPIRFRYRKNRNRGTYFIVKFSGGKDHWHKAGTYPDLPVKAFLSILPELCKELAVQPSGGSIAATGWTTVGEVLEWYGQRVATDGHLSKKRKAGTRSAVNRQLLPRLGELPISAVNRATLDAQLMWPMQQEYALSHVRLVFGVLKVAMKQAHGLGLIGANPLAGMTFTDFIKTKIKPKDARLRPADAAQLLAQWSESYTTTPATVTLATLMLAHGTRVGETRLAKWRSFDLAGQVWHIPASDTKTKKAHALPLTRQVCALLERYRENQSAAGYKGAYLFPGAQGHPMSERKVQNDFACLASDEWTSHDLRKLARTAWADLGVDYLIGELLLNHALKALDTTYIHTTAETLKRDALERWHAWLDEHGFAALHSAKAR